MELFKKTCKNPMCSNEFMGTRTQQYCCIDCRARNRKHHHIKKLTLDDVARKAKANGMSYGKYVAMQYRKDDK